jgi:hypothetical protein
MHISATQSPIFHIRKKQLLWHCPICWTFLCVPWGRHLYVELALKNPFCPECFEAFNKKQTQGVL